MRTARDSIEIYVGAAMSLFQHFITDPAKAALAKRVGATENDNSHEERKLPTYCLIVNYLLASYTTENMKAEA